MSKPLSVKISGPSGSKSGRTESQYTATIVAPDASVRYLTWSSTMSPDDLADSLKEAWQNKQGGNRNDQTNQVNQGGQSQQPPPAPAPAQTGGGTNT